ncbi:MAG: phosphatidylinositol-specific phospholipase C1-like protein [Saprospiraceae bacterium]|nr:phosphatidylinositol-specific phospholipase C1-like protein [Saprospiraceae bacterium]
MSDHHLLYRNFIFLCCLWFLLSALKPSCQAQGDMNLNHIQIIGSHNSYKQAIEQPLMDLMKIQRPDVIGL